MNFHRLLFCLAMLLCSTLDAALASGNANLAVHDQELGSDTLTKKRLRDSVAKEDDDEERLFTGQVGSSAAKTAYDLKTKQALQSHLDSTKALGELDILKHEEHVEKMLKSSSFMRALKTNQKALYEDLVNKFGISNVEEIMYIGANSKNTKVKKLFQKFIKVQYEHFDAKKSLPSRHTEKTNLQYIQWRINNGKDPHNFSR